MINGDILFLPPTTEYIMHNITRHLTLTLALCAAFCAAMAAESGSVPEPSAPDMVIDAGIRAQVIEELTSKMSANYVFPDVAAKMNAEIRTRHKNGEYDQITSAVKFAELLATQMRDVSHDKHIQMRHEKERPRTQSSADQGPKTNPDRVRNYGFAKYELLPGNVAYLELRGFSEVDAAASETASAAMNMVAGADALIIDLRRNGGGAPEMVALVTSYLYGDKKVHLNDLYFRPTDKTQQFWTTPKVAGKRYGPDKPVYVLTSANTFSAAEEFSYNLKNLKRATIVGETTAGGANPGDVMRTGEHFSTFVPTGRAISPITKTNWEGVGVVPDVAVPADKALLTAQIMATKPIAAAAAEPRTRARFAKHLQDLQAALDKPIAQ